NGADFVLEDTGSATEVMFSSMRLNRALNVWNVEVSVKKKGASDWEAPLVLQVEQLTGSAGLVNPEGISDDNPATPYVDLSNWVTNRILRPGERSAPRTLSLRVTPNVAPSIISKVYGHRSALVALALARTLNAAGQPLGEVEVAEAGPSGAKNYKSDANAGVVTLGQGTGNHSWRFSK